MTLNAARSRPDLIANLIRFGTQSLRWTVRFTAGVLIVAFAGLVALMTAFAGVMIAMVAVLLRLVQSGEAAPRQTSTAQPVTLEARRTPRGWTVE